MRITQEHVNNEQVDTANSSTTKPDFYGYSETINQLNISCLHVIFTNFVKHFRHLPQALFVLRKKYNYNLLLCREQHYRLTAVDLFAGGLEDRLTLDKLLCRLFAGDDLLSEDSSLLSRTRCRVEGCFTVGPFFDDDVLSSDIRLELDRGAGLLWGFT